jgi:hypothetical protein
LCKFIVRRRRAQQVKNSRLYGGFGVRQVTLGPLQPRFQDKGVVHSPQSRTFTKRRPRHGLSDLKRAQVPSQRIFVIFWPMCKGHRDCKPDVQRDIGLALGKNGDPIREAHNLAVKARDRESFRPLSEGSPPREAMCRLLQGRRLELHIPIAAKPAKQDTETHPDIVKPYGCLGELTGSIQSAGKGVPKLANALFWFPRLKFESAHGYDLPSPVDGRDQIQESLLDICIVA